MSATVPWADAMREALYGPRGFYRCQVPHEHFQTASHSSSFAIAIAQLIDLIDDGLGRPATLDVVDLAAGRGELLARLHDLVSPRVRLVGVELSGRAPLEDLGGRVMWTDVLPPGIQGLLIANEWLDNVPVDVVEVDEHGEPRLVEVDPETGAEALGSVLTADDPRWNWLEAWWPIAEAAPGTRGEVGLARDSAWRDAVGHLAAGLAVAIDYAHTASSRPPYGSLTGYRRGRAVRPVPDATMDLTAHVAIDACAAAVPTDAHGSTSVTSVTNQRAALTALGTSGARPQPSDFPDARSYLEALGRASEAGLLTDPGGMGAFAWLSHARAMSLPEPLADPSSPARA